MTSAAIIKAFCIALLGSGATVAVQQTHKVYKQRTHRTHAVAPPCIPVPEGHSPLEPVALDIPWRGAEVPTTSTLTLEVLPPRVFPFWDDPIHSGGGFVQPPLVNPPIITPPAPPPNIVPEPAVWSLMVIGFGVVGVKMRQKAET